MSSGPAKTPTTETARHRRRAAERRTSRDAADPWLEELAQTPLSTRLVLAAIVSANALLLFVYLVDLWRYELYRFFPLLLLAAGYVAMRRAAGRRWRHNPDVQVRQEMLLFSASALTFLGLVLWQPCLGFLSTLFVLAIIAVACDAPLGASLWGPLLLLGLIVRLPLEWGAAFMSTMRALTVGWSSRLLDGLGVEHYATGGVLSLPGVTFTTPWLCSGWNSLLFLLALAGLVVLLRRRSLAHAVLLLGLTVALTLLTNVFRLTLTIGMCAAVGSDVASGWNHVLLGLGFLALSAGLVWSGDWLIAYLLEPIDAADASESRIRDLEFRRPWTARWNALVSWPRPSTKSRGRSASASGVGSRRSRDRDSNEYGFRAPELPGWVCAALLTAMVLGVVGASQRVSAAADRPELLIVRTGDLPETLGEWRRVEFKQTRRSEQDLAERSSVWRYRAANGEELRVAIDEPFRSGGALTRPYEQLGWRLETQRLERLELNGRRWALVLARFIRPNNNALCVAYSLADRNRRPLAPLHVATSSSQSPPAFLLRLWRDGGDPDSLEDAGMLELYLQVLSTLLDAPRQTDVPEAGHP